MGNFRRKLGREGEGIWEKGDSLHLKLILGLEVDFGWWIRDEEKRGEERRREATEYVEIKVF